MEHKDKKPPRLWLLGYSLLPEDARGSNHSCRTKQQIFLHCCQNLLWAAKAGRVALMVPICFPSRITLNSPLCGRSLAVLIISTCSCPRGKCQWHISGHSQLFSLSSAALSLHTLVTPREKPAQKSAHLYSACFTVCLSSPAWFYIVWVEGGSS